MRRLLNWLFEKRCSGTFRRHCFHRTQSNVLQRFSRKDCVDGEDARANGYRCCRCHVEEWRELVLMDY